MAAIDNKVETLAKSGCDICKHLRTIQHHSSLCDHVTEFGIRTGNSTAAILAGRPKRFVTYDITLAQFPKERFMELAREVNVELVVIEGNSIEVEIEPTDMLMIDSQHCYTHLMTELTLHSDKVSKFIIMHDTDKFATKSPKWLWKQYPEDKERGLWTAIQDFLKDSYEWELKKRYTHNNGLTILQRKPDGI